MNLPFWLLLHLSVNNVTEIPTRPVDIPRRRTVEVDIMTPSHMDWREYGLVSPVRKQGSCNSCYAFAAAGSIEYWARKKYGDVSVDVQTALDCSPRVYGCSGGLMEHVYEMPGYFDLEYHYDGKVEPCQHSSKGVEVLNFKVVDLNVEASLETLLMRYGPVPVAVDSSGWVNYHGGIMHECGKVPDHAVLVVGYTQKYWIVKNTMGPKWGENGYAKISRSGNVCGIDTYAAVVTKVAYHI